MLILLLYIVRLLLRAFRLLFVMQGNYTYMTRARVCVCVCALSCSVVSDSATPWTVAHNSLFMGFAKRKYWSGLPFPSPVFFCELHSVIMKKYLKTHVKTLTICFLTIYFLCVCVLSHSVMSDSLWPQGQ